MSLPYLTDSVPPVDGEFRVRLEDFEVEEIPAYEPSGEGEHVFAWIEKRGLTTPQAVKALCRATGARQETAGWAGLKDRRSISRQWVSLWGVTPDQVRDRRVDGLEVLRVGSHPTKLRTGHLKANRFVIRLRNVSPAGMDHIGQALRRIVLEGLPNYFGAQRFGRERDNADKALRWVRDGEAGPRGRFDRKLWMSALQSELFNRRVADRVRTRTLGRVFDGDLMQRADSGGLFTATDITETQTRADRWEVSPTGPMFGAKMRWPEGTARAQEEQLLQDAGLTKEQLAKVRRHGPGTRRSVRVRPDKVRVEAVAGAAVLEFTLPSGSYATILIREILKRDAPTPQTS